MKKEFIDKLKERDTWRRIMQSALSCARAGVQSCSAWWREHGPTIIKTITQWIDSAKKMPHQQFFGGATATQQEVPSVDNAEIPPHEQIGFDKSPDTPRKKRFGIKFSLWKPKSRKAKIWTAATTAVVAGVGIFLLTYDFSFDAQQYRKAKRGDAVAQYSVACTLMYKSSYQSGKEASKSREEALEWLRKSANQGYAQAQYELSKNLSGWEFFDWLQKAAKGGYAEAQSDLAYHYKYGTHGVKVDHKKAFEWYLEAAKNGDEGAMNTVGECYLAGDGVIADMGKAEDWFTKAAEKNNHSAQVNLGKLCLKVFPKNAVKWFRKAAYSNHEAQYYLGKCYLEGNGVDLNKKEAVEWFRKAADGYSPPAELAQYELGKCYYNGVGVAQDEEAAFNCFRKAAERGHAASQCLLGIFYSGGNIVPLDLHKAVDWYTKSAKQGDAHAQFFLGECYYKGEGVFESREKAIDWWRKSAAQGNKDAIDALQKIGKQP